MYVDVFIDMCIYTIYDPHTCMYTYVHTHMYMTS